MAHRYFPLERTGWTKRFADWARIGSPQCFRLASIWARHPAIARRAITIGEMRYVAEKKRQPQWYIEWLKEISSVDSQCIISCRPVVDRSHSFGSNEGGLGALGTAEVGTSPTAHSCTYCTFGAQWRSAQIAVVAQEANETMGLCECRPRLLEASLPFCTGRQAKPTELAAPLGPQRFHGLSR